MKKLDPAIVKVLLGRTWWREGTLDERLLKTEIRARERVHKPYAGVGPSRNRPNPKLERRIARAAKAVRKAGEPS